MACEWGYGLCTAPDTNCPHWIGICCELDEAFILEYPWLNNKIWEKLINEKRGSD